MTRIPRVALFADSFHEVNGAANVLRHLENFARINGFPFLCIRGAKETNFASEGTSQALDLKRSRASLAFDGDLRYDPLFWRHIRLIKRKLADFKPDVIHVTGLNDVSQIGFYFAHRQNIPAVATWHTNVHEYVASRMLSGLRWLPGSAQTKIGHLTEKGVLQATMKLLFLAQIQLAPNAELVDELARKTRRPSFLMTRGVDTEFLTPEKRRRTDSTFVLGYVGRLRPEKNVRFFERVEQALVQEGITDYKFVLVGEGTEDSWLNSRLKKRELVGVLRGEALAEAFANMDLFVFPSKTDAFGNVVLEAMASGVPAVVMPEGGPKYLIEHGTNGFVAKDESDFLNTVVRAAQNRETLSEMSVKARAAACQRSWQNVFEGLYEKYDLSTKVGKGIRADPPKKAADRSTDDGGGDAL